MLRCLAALLKPMGVGVYVIGLVIGIKELYYFALGVGAWHFLLEY